ncbi:Peptide methionine sulfoxide reductase msrA/msrB [Giardia duodenalis assemblage B]|uniref:Peptide methionine sulfoxide reductase msrA/msrB n=1 Tax=Giardia duodenalis assemblage B TaxID=1394984 RepID=A0A132NTI0_GIAIN|nr:Peptide methionine sulfoxide reductase msrA/msrB [Giardia intestinalis assemblage B]
MLNIKATSKSKEDRSTSTRSTMYTGVYLKDV